MISKNHLKPGQQHIIQLEMKDGSEMTYSMKIEMMTPQPSNSNSSIQIQTYLKNSGLIEGQSTTLTVIVKNIKDIGLPMCVAIVGLPGGLEPSHNKLQELVKSNQIAFYEVRGRELIFYWRYMAPKQEIVLNLDMIASIPGTYKGPASKSI